MSLCLIATMMAALAIGDPPPSLTASAIPSLIPDDNEIPFSLIICDDPFGIFNKNSHGTQTTIEHQVTAKTHFQCFTSEAEESLKIVWIGLS